MSRSPGTLRKSISFASAHSSVHSAASGNTGVDSTTHNDDNDGDNDEFALSSPQASRIAKLSSKMRASSNTTTNSNTNSMDHSSSHNTNKTSKSPWKNKDWDDSSGDLSFSDDDEDKGKTAHNEPATPMLKKSFFKVAQAAIPENLQAKNKTVGKTKHGVSKMKLAGLKGLLQNAVLDEMDEINRKEQQASNNKNNSNPLAALANMGGGKKGGASLLPANKLLSVMVQASQNKIQQKRRLRGRDSLASSSLFGLNMMDSKFANTPVVRKRLNKAAGMIQRFIRRSLYALRHFQQEKKYFVRELEDIQERKKEKLADIREWIEQETSDFRRTLQAEMGDDSEDNATSRRDNSGLSPSWSHDDQEQFDTQAQALRQEIATLKEEHEKLLHDVKEATREQERLELEASDPERGPAERTRLELKIQELTQDKEDWENLQEIHRASMQEVEPKIPTVEDQFKMMRRKRKTVTKTIDKILKMTNQQLENDTDEQHVKLLEKVIKLKTKKDAKFEYVKELRKQGLYPVPDDYEDDDDEKVPRSSSIVSKTINANKAKMAEAAKLAAKRESSLPPPPATTVAKTVVTIPTLTKKATGNAKEDFVSGRDATFDDVYEQGELLGEGAFGAVYKCRRKDTGVERAVKILDKRHMDQWEYDSVVQEFQMLTKLDNDNVIRVYEFYSTDESFYIVQELAKGGELYDELLSRGKFQEQDVATLMRGILACVEHLAKTHVIHRDINLENILLDDVNNLATLKLIDFGLAAKAEEGERIFELAGKARYIPPEMLGENGYGLKSDVWSCGVTAYTLLSGFHPFEAEYDTDVYPLIVEGYVDFKDKVWEGVSDQAKDFVTKLLTYKEEERPTAEQALKHPWFTANDTGLTFSAEAPAPQIVWTASTKKELAVNVAEATAEEIKAKPKKKKKQKKVLDAHSSHQISSSSSSKGPNPDMKKKTASAGDLSGSNAASPLKKKKKKKTEEEKIAELLQKRTNKLEETGEGEDMFSKIVFSDFNQGVPKNGAKAKSQSMKLKGAGASLLRGAVKDVVGRQRRASALMTLIKSVE